MKIAIIGSRKITDIDIGKFVSDADEIVSGGAVGVDACAEEYAKTNGLSLTVFLPEYERYGRGAPIVRNKQIVDYADKIVAFWNGSSARSSQPAIFNCSAREFSSTRIPMEDNSSAMSSTG